MRRLRSIVIDDEPKSREVLIELIDMFCDTVDVVAQAGTIEEALKVIGEEKPDLVFFDILLQEGDSFEIIRRLETVDFDMIFVTAFDQSSVKALMYSGVKVLLKPIQISDLVDAVAEIERMRGRSYSNYLMAEDILKSKFTSLPVPTTAGLVYKETSEIICVRTSEKGSLITFYDGMETVSERSLRELREILANVELEQRRSVLYNRMQLNHQRSTDQELVFKNGMQLHLD